MKEPSVPKSIAIIFLVLGIYFTYKSALTVGIFFFVLSAISLAFWLVYQRLEEIEQKIEMINNHSIKNDERLYNIEQFIKKPENGECS